MNYLLSGVSIITIGGLLYNFINLFLAKKTDLIFFTDGKKLLLNIANGIVMIVLMSILINIFPLLFIKIKLNDSILNVSGIVLFILIIIAMILYLINQIRYLKATKLLRSFYSNSIIEIILIFILVLFGTVNILKIAQFDNNYYINSNDISAVSTIWALISVFIIRLYKSEYRKTVPQICWIDYVNDEKMPEKYYIFYASDNEYVVCGKKEKYEENDEFRFIKIKDIKTKYTIHIYEKCN
jgi:hypothetical protein